MPDQDIPARIKNMQSGATLDLPGTFTNIHISNPLKADRADAAGKGGTLKQAQGYSDFKVDLSLDLAGEEALADLKKIQDFYRPQGVELGTPPTFLVVTPETAVMGVGELLWLDVSMDRANYDDVLPVHLPFEEVNAADLAGPDGGEGTGTGGGDGGEGAYNDDYTDWLLNSEGSHVGY